MNDDAGGLALRDHLEVVLADVAPRPSLLADIRAEHQRRLRMRAVGLGVGSAVTAAAATAAVLLVPALGADGDHRGGQPVPLDSAAYPPAQPAEKWFTRPYPLPRPSGEIAQYALPAQERDPAGSQRTLLVWYNADKDAYCAHDIVQTAANPEGSDDPSTTGGCSANPPITMRRTGLVMGSVNCKKQGWEYWFGVLVPGATTVKVDGVGGPDPAVVVRRLDGAPRSFFLVIDPAAPTMVFRYLDADGHQVGDLQDATPLASGHGLWGCVG